MTYYIYHWYRGSSVAPVPEATKQVLQFNGEPVNDWTVEVSDLQEFVLKYGPIILKAPEINFPYWSIYVTDKSGRFLQK